MKIVYLWRAPQLFDYMLTNTDGHFATLEYLGRYYDVRAFVPGWEGDVRRGNVWIHGRRDVATLLDAVRQHDPDALVCYGPATEPEWPDARAAAPRAVFCLDYAGGPLAGVDGELVPQFLQFDHVFVAHETQAAWLRERGVSASRARGVDLCRYRPIPGVPKLWHVFCPTTFAPGKRPALAAQYLEQYRPTAPSLFLGSFEHPQVIDMVRQGNVPLNLSGVPHRHGIDLGGRAPYAVMPLLYNASDVVVCLSQEEAGPWVPMEALACGTPAVVAADCAWLVSEAFAAVEAQFPDALAVVDPSPDAVARAVARLLDAPPRRGLGPRAAAVACFDWWPMYVEIDRRLKNLVGLKQAGQPRPAGV